MAESGVCATECESSEYKQNVPICFSRVSIECKLWQCVAFSFASFFVCSLA